MKQEPFAQDPLSAATPLYVRVTRELRRRIREGEYLPGTRMPGHARIAREFQVSALTANRALRELEREKLVERRERAGTFVAAVVHGPRRLTLALPDEPEKEGGERLFHYVYGCLERARTRGIELNLRQRGELEGPTGKALADLLGDGLLCPVKAPPELAERLRTTSVPMVVIGKNEGPGDGFVCAPYRDCARELTATMIADGFRNIAFVGNLGASNHRLARDGYLEAIAPLGLGRRWVRDADTDAVQDILAELFQDSPRLDGLVIAGGGLPIAATPTLFSRPSPPALGVFRESSAIDNFTDFAYIGSFSMVEAGTMAVDLLADLYDGALAAPQVRLETYRISRPRKGNPKP